MYRNVGGWRYRAGRPTAAAGAVGDGPWRGRRFAGERRRERRRGALVGAAGDEARDVGGVRAAGAAQVGVELLVAEAHLALVGLAAPQAGRRRLVDDRLRHAEVARELAHGRLGEVAQGQQVDAAVAVLGEVADGQLAGVAGADHTVAQVVGEGVEGGHAQPRLDVGHGGAVVAGRLGRSSRRRPALQVVQRGRQVDGARRQGEAFGDHEAGVGGVGRVALAGHDHAQGVVGEGARAQGRDDRRVDAARQAEHRAAAAARRDLRLEPLDQM